MRVNGYRCDACCKEHLIDSMAAPPLSTLQSLPSTWLALYEYGKEPLMFCSVKCLWDWAEKQITGLREVKALPEENTDWKVW